MTRCIETIGEDTWHTRQCSRKAIVERDGLPYCKVHDPEYKKAREVEKQIKFEKDNRSSCGHHFYESWHKYCPMCGTKINK